MGSENIQDSLVLPEDTDHVRYYDIPVSDEEYEELKEMTKQQIEESMQDVPLSNFETDVTNVRTKKTAWLKFGNGPKAYKASGEIHIKTDNEASRDFKERFEKGAEIIGTQIIEKLKNTPPQELKTTFENLIYEHDTFKINFQEMPMGWEDLSEEILGRDKGEKPYTGLPREGSIYILLRCAEMFVRTYLKNHLSAPITYETNTTPKTKKTEELTDLFDWKMLFPSDDKSISPNGIDFVGCFNLKSFTHPAQRNIDSKTLEIADITWTN
jgi:hypothetical protein